MDHPPQDSQNPYASPAIPSNAERPTRSPNKPNEPLVQPIRISGILSLEDYFRGESCGKEVATTNLDRSDCGRAASYVGSILRRDYSRQFYAGCNCLCNPLGGLVFDDYRSPMADQSAVSQGVSGKEFFLMRKPS